MTATQLKDAITCKASSILNGIVKDAYLGVVKKEKRLLFVKLMAVARIMYEGMDCEVLTSIECWFKTIGK